MSALRAALRVVLLSRALSTLACLAHRLIALLAALLILLSLLLALGALSCLRACGCALRLILILLICHPWFLPFVLLDKI